MEGVFGRGPDQALAEYEERMAAKAATQLQQELDRLKAARAAGVFW